MFWAKIHGATTHFPVALVLCSGACDLAGFVMTTRPAARDLRVVGYWTMVLGALGSVPAILAGLMMTHGSVLGHGALRWHHLFAWPAFTLMIGAAAWRVCVGNAASRRAWAGYLAIVAATCVLVCGAGYWGGELMSTR